MSKNAEVAENIRTIVKAHHQWMDECLPLIASENVTSHAVREMMATDLSHRYAEGQPGERYYQGCTYIDEIEKLTKKLGRQLFNAKHVNVQATSGVVANLAAYTALGRSGDTMMSLHVPDGGHISHSRISAAGVMDLKVKNFIFDPREMNIDVDATQKAILVEKPKFLYFGGSVFLFPHPVSELRAAADEVGASIGYDAAHVLGLIAGGQFQKPLKEGADIMASSRHKTFPGPQGGILFTDSDRLKEKIDNAVFPGVVSNHHLHHLAGLAVALAEMLEFGEDYAAQTIANAKALAEALYERGFEVLCEHKGFTESHQVLVDVTHHGKGTRVAKALEENNIIINKNLLSWDRLDKSVDPSGIRIGTQELTRLGMCEGEMEVIAEFIKNVVIDDKSVKQEVIDFRRDFTTLNFSFTKGQKAYEYIEFGD
ncbi:serine hydroxymethyltransferase [archaeon BMS3Abin16]|nr:serine hydroxymethyltransferase [archaeon BMS3Abin16]HDY74818.1 serine hydroxymethyltransferase [Euryarchaeota archaeon]